jgi:hypothetical protein
MRATSRFNRTKPDRSIERLEARRLLAAVAWDGGGDGVNWIDPLNWSSNAMPASADDVTINVPTSNPTIVISSGTQTINSLTSSEAITLSGATLSVAASSQVNAPFNFTGGALGGAGSFTVNGPLTWSGGSMIDSGSTIIGASGSLLMNSGNVKDLSRPIVNNGTATWSAGDFRFFGGTVTNNGSFTVDASANGVSGYGLAGTNLFTNAGTLTKIGPNAGGFTVANNGIQFDNPGTVSVQTGALFSHGGGTDNGDFTIANAATLELSGNNTLASTCDVSGPGTMRVVGGATDFAGTAPAAAFAIAGGRLNFNSTISTSGAINLSSGVLGGSGAATFGGASTWSGGTMDGSGSTIIPNGASLSMLSGNVKDIARTLGISGSATWTAGDFRFFGGTVNNTGTFTIDTSGNNLSGYGLAGINTFNNAGTLSKISAGSGGFGIANNGIALNNSGNVSVLAGTLYAQGGGTDSGDFAFAGASATLELSGDNSLAATSDISGNGTLRVVGGTTDFAGTAPTANFAIAGGRLNFNSTVNTSGALNLSGGVLGGTGAVTFGGASTWTGGTMDGGGSTVIANGASLVMSSGNVKDLARVINNGGATTWTAGDFRWFGGMFNNNGTFTIDTSANNLSSYGLAGTNVFNNAGTSSKISAGAGGFGIANNGISFNNSGNVSVQAGTLYSQGGGTDSGDFALGAASAVFELSGANTLAATSDITGNGTFRVVGGTTDFAGTAPAASFAIAGGTCSVNSNITTSGALTLSSGVLGGGGTVSFAGASAWTGGAMTGTGTTVIPSSGSLTLFSGNVKDLARQITNNGSTTWSAGDFRFFGGSFLDNGTFTADTTNNNLSAYGLSGTNSFAVGTGGTFNKIAIGDAGFTVANTGIAFDNSGVVSVQAGAVQMHGGGTSGGGYALASGTTLELAGTHAMSSATNVTGNGTFKVAGGTTDFAGSAPNASFSITGGAANLNSSFTTSGNLLLAGGTLAGSGAVTFAGAGSSWTAGTMAGSGSTIIPPGAAMTMSTGSVHDIARLLTNNGAMTWTSGDFRFFGGTVTNNGIFTIDTSANNLSGYGLSGTNAFNNAGTLNKISAGAGGFTIANNGVALSNTGNINVQAGTFFSYGGTTSSGDVTLGSAGSVLELAGTNTMASTCDITGAGLVRILNGTTDFAGAAPDGNFAVNGGTLTFLASQQLQSLTIGGGVTVLAANGNRVLLTRNLTVAPGAVLDLNDNDIIVDYTGASQLAAIQALINTARNGGAWNLAGITSAAARNNAAHNTTLGTMEAGDYKSIYGPSATFDGQAIDSTAVLVKYTYYGDTDFNGKVNFDDYVRTDSGFNNHRSGWTNGDFNGDGQVNFDDYVLIDLAFNTQSGTLSHRPKGRAGLTSMP